MSASTASADSGRDGDPGAVFVQLNSTTGNEVAAYTRGPDGILAPASTYPTGGLGGTEVGAPLDALASQNSLVLDRDHRLLLAVNAGSDTITSFAVRGARLSQGSVVASGGQFPSSIAVHDDLVYVLNAGGDGSISGFQVKRGGLVPLAGSTRSLGLSNANPPVFISAPAQIGFAKDGRTLIVTTKNHNQILTFPLDKRGLPSPAPVVTASAGAVPFSFVVDQRGTVHVTEAGTGKTSSYAIAQSGSLTLLGSSAATGGAALCWNILIGRNIYGANAGSATLSAWRVGATGAATLTAPVAATTNAGPIDLAASSNGRYLYVQEAVAGTVGAYAVSGDGSLQRIQTVTGLPAFTTTGMEGIAAS
ncbi:lactonase family protein [Pengzhenrongella phosphoraccumulans]|uniref:lactonase family protein n=1 Tax=Pengzhenrongella phosphoraccumulans TaxID=3114394 RepID=UPI0038905022